MYDINLVSFIIALIILFIFYRKVILPFSKRMLDLKAEEELELEETTIHFDDEDLFDDSDEKYQEQVKKIKQQIDSQNEGSEENMKYEILLERLREMATDNTPEVSNVLKELTIEDEEKEKGKY
ncbi:MAG: hypothetical protein OIF32_03540 [Campylobacterales bacterium]|nr:hypothetical protein [Campylobacterales bacterium]